jgi:DNA-binding transcriptional regulator LsrR (DeoR family)
MTIDPDEHRLLYRIAQAYYSNGQTQQEIARRFGLSRPKVSRLLQKARDARIVHITLVPPSGGLADLERHVEERYSLEEVVLVRCSDPHDSDLVALELGAAAADCLVRSLTEGSVLGLAWGRSILAMVDALPVHPFLDLTVVQVSGGLGPVGAVEHSAEVARRAAQKLGARLRLLPAPGIVSSVEAARALRDDYQISQVLNLAAQATVAVLGLGVPAPDSVLLRDGNIISPADLTSLQASGAVGDLALRYVDAEGRPVDLEFNERIIGLTLEQIARIPRVIGVAGGVAKREIVLAALRAGILDVLVTDQATAEGLLEDAA